MTLFQGKYRIESARFRDWDYTSAGWYFVTVCCADKACAFGIVRSNVVLLNTLGKAAHAQWQQIPDRRAGISLDAFVIMPNHLHGIIVLKPAAKLGMPYRRSVTPRLRPASLGSVVGSFKAGVTRWSIENGFALKWQPRFHDRIIRSSASLAAAREYIALNPANWDEDEYRV